MVTVYSIAINFIIIIIIVVISITITIGSSTSICTILPSTSSINAIDYSRHNNSCLSHRAYS